MKAIILAGGRGVRLHPYTKILPKPLIPLGDIPILQVILMQLREAGFCDVTLSLCYKAAQIERFFGDGEWLGLDISYSRSNKLLGTAGPISLIPPFDEPCLVMNSDLLTAIDFADVYAAHRRSGAAATVVLCRHTVEIGFGTVEVDHQQHITSYVEKPKLSFLVSGGIYIINPTLLRYIAHGEYLDMPTLMQLALADGLTINSYIFEGDWFDIGTIEQYHRAEEAFLTHQERYLRIPPDRLLQTEVNHDHTPEPATSAISLSGRC